MKYKPTSFLTLILILGLNSVSFADDLSSFEWTKDIKPGATKTDVKQHLEALGVKVSIGGKATTYTSILNTEKRDYLFCNNELFAMIEGEHSHPSGYIFNKWLTGYLAAHDRHGNPLLYEADSSWGFFMTKWDVSDSVLYYRLQQVFNSGNHNWSRQLYHKHKGIACSKYNEM